MADMFPVFAAFIFVSSLGTEIKEISFIICPAHGTNKLHFWVPLWLLSRAGFRSKGACTKREKKRSQQNPTKTPRTAVHRQHPQLLEREAYMNTFEMFKHIQDYWLLVSSLQQ